MVKNIIIHYEVPYKSGISSAVKKDKQRLFTVSVWKLFISVYKI